MAQISIPACRTCPVREEGVCGAGGEVAWRGLSRIGASVRLSPSQCLFGQDEGADHVFVVASGALKLHHTLPDGRRTVVGFAGPGDLVGIEGGRLAAAEATSRVRACRFPSEGFRAAVAEQVAGGRYALDAVRQTSGGRASACCLSRGGGRWRGPPLSCCPSRSGTKGRVRHRDARRRGDRGDPSRGLPPRAGGPRPPRPERGAHRGARGCG